MTTRGIGAEQRRSPRIDVRHRVNGRVVSVDTPIVIHDLSRTGFAVASPTAFTPGETLEFRLEGPHERIPVRVTARAVHTRPISTTPGWHVSGFMFVPSKLLGLVPQSMIDRLIESATESRALVFTEI